MIRAKGQLMCAGKQIDHVTTGAADQCELKLVLPTDCADGRQQTVIQSNENSCDLARRTGSAFVGVRVAKRLFGFEQLSRGDWTRAEEKNKGGYANKCCSSFRHGAWS